MQGLGKDCSSQKVKGVDKKSFESKTISYNHPVLND